MFNETEDIVTRNVDKTHPVTTKTESSDDDVAIESPRKPSIEEKLFSKMCSCSRETICLLLVITFSLAFAALHSAPPKISKPPPARPFFNENSVIIDFYKGQLSSMIERASDADVSFVMYYAPWDAESQTLRDEFERVAVHYQSQIFFAAINCWHPGSECRNQYNKIHSYPVLVVYPLRGPGVQYKGINTASYIMRFLEAFLKPIHRISSRDELKELLIEKDAALVGFFDFNGLSNSPGYQTFYKAAIRALEKDPNQDVTFAAVTNVHTAYNEFGIEHTPAASLHLWNESLIYPQDKPWVSENILQWMGQSMHKVSLWIQPPGVKSSTLAPYLHSGPVLLLFTPRNPLYSSNYNYDLLREVALEYYNCGDIITMDHLSENLQVKRANAAVRHNQKRKECSELLVQSRIHTTSLPISISIQQWINESCCAKVFMNKCLLCERYTSNDAVCNIDLKELNKICRSKDIFKMENPKDNTEEEHYCCGNYFHKTESETMSKGPKKPSSTFVPEYDAYSGRAMQLHAIGDKCLKFLAGEKYHYPIFGRETNEDANIKLSTTACSVNRTLAFLAVDSLHYLHFAEALGVDILKMRHKTAVVILDSLQESMYLMPERLSRRNLIKYLNNYANGSLSRALRSNSSKRTVNTTTDPACSDENPSTICVPELNTKNFLKTILNPMKDVIVMYHSPYCAFCSAISYVFLTVARLLSTLKHVSFVRIDGDNNDLPWEYSMNRYPSILFFPAKRKEDSTVFPFSQPITIANLLNFILANFEDDTHVEALINICHIGSGESPKDCVARVRRLCLDTIENYLQYYRKLRRDKNFPSKTKIAHRVILFKLEHIRDVHLILNTVDDLKTNDTKYQLLIDKFSIYRKQLNEINKRRVVEKISPRNERIVKDEL